MFNAEGGAQQTAAVAPPLNAVGQQQLQSATATAATHQQAPPPRELLYGGGEAAATTIAATSDVSAVQQQQQQMAAAIFANNNASGGAGDAMNSTNMQRFVRERKRAAEQLGPSTGQTAPQCAQAATRAHACSGRRPRSRPSSLAALLAVDATCALLPISSALARVRSLSRRVATRRWRSRARALARHAAAPSRARVFAPLLLFVGD